MFRQVAASSLVMGMLLVVGPSSAQSLEPPRNRGAIQVGLRLGYGVPFGQFGQASPGEFNMFTGEVSRFMAGQIPIGLDAGYLITPHVYVGLSFQYGFGLDGSTTKDSCGLPEESCLLRDTTLGVGAQFHLNPSASFDPWVGLGGGYEWFDYIVPEGVRTTWSVSGFQYLNLQLGGDVRLTSNFAAGPFVSFSAGQYATVKLTTESTATGDYVNKAFHEWLLFGVRGVYNIRL